MYIIYDFDSIWEKTCCPNAAVAIALKRYNQLPDELKKYVKVKQIGTYGKYAATPGEPYEVDFDWQRAYRELSK